MINSVIEFFIPKTNNEISFKNAIKVDHDDQLKAGTGFMLSLTDAIKNFQLLGYSQNFICMNDHLKSECRKIKVFPNEIKINEVLRFENTSDPSDQSILYAISVPAKNLKGLYVESYGLDHDDQNDELRKSLMMKRL